MKPINPNGEGVAIASRYPITLIEARTELDHIVRFLPDTNNGTDTFEANCRIRNSYAHVLDLVTLFEENRHPTQEQKAGFIQSVRVEGAFIQSVRVELTCAIKRFNAELARNGARRPRQIVLAAERKSVRFAATVCYFPSKAGIWFNDEKYQPKPGERIRTQRGLATTVDNNGCEPEYHHSCDYRKSDTNGCVLVQLDNEKRNTYVDRRYIRPLR